jgi:hypothetical protein
MSKTAQISFQTDCTLRVSGAVAREEAFHVLSDGDSVALHG